MHDTTAGCCDGLQTRAAGGLRTVLVRPVGRPPAAFSVYPVHVAAGENAATTHPRVAAAANAAVPAVAALASDGSGGSSGGEDEEAGGLPVGGTVVEMVENGCTFRVSVAAGVTARCACCSLLLCSHSSPAGALSTSRSMRRIW